MKPMNVIIVVHLRLVEIELYNHLMVRVAVEDVRRLMGELMKERAEVGQLRKELQFYRAHAGEGNANPVLRSLRV